MNGRLIIDEPAEAAWNMAVDQALLESVSAGAKPVLRFYAWQQPTLSLGYFQSLADRDQHGPSRDLPVVRRSSGGGAIVHDRELTYSLVVPIRDRASKKVQRMVDLVHGAIRGAFSLASIPLSRVGEDRSRSRSTAFLCFQRRSSEDLQCAGYKVVGSAQRRTAGAVLQHGSILLSVSDKTPELPGICDLVGRRIGVDELITQIVQQLQIGFLEVSDWQPAGLSASERSGADQGAVARFSNSRWLDRRP